MNWKKLSCRVGWWSKADNKATLWPNLKVEIFQIFSWAEILSWAECGNEQKSNPTWPKKWRQHDQNTSKQNMQHPISGLFHFLGKVVLIFWLSKVIFIYGQHVYSSTLVLWAKMSIYHKNTTSKNDLVKESY